MTTPALKLVEEGRRQETEGLSSKLFNLLPFINWIVISATLH
jgi:hypothetical protein